MVVAHHLVGRAEELRSLEHLLDELGPGRPGVIELVGEPGLGGWFLAVLGALALTESVPIDNQLLVVVSVGFRSESGRTGHGWIETHPKICSGWDSGLHCWAVSPAPGSDSTPATSCWHPSPPSWERPSWPTWPSSSATSSGSAARLNRRIRHRSANWLRSHRVDHAYSLGE